MTYRAEDWKPGDVALVTWRVMGEPHTQVAVRSHYAKVEADVWWGAEGWLGDSSTKDARRLVVIDPEDEQQTERLAELWLKQTHFEPGPRPMTALAYRMQAALREFAKPTPPKPEEPTGLGAVVRDKDGEVWVRITDPALDKPWRDVRGIGARRHWQIVDAVEVLSEGVTP